MGTIYRSFKVEYIHVKCNKLQPVVVAFTCFEGGQAWEASACGSLGSDAQAVRLTTVKTIQRAVVH